MVSENQECEHEVSEDVTNVFGTIGVRNIVSCASVESLEDGARLLVWERVIIAVQDPLIGTLKRDNRCCVEKIESTDIDKELGNSWSE